MTTQTQSIAPATVSLLTPSGVGAIAVIRVEGTGAEHLLRRLFRPRGGLCEAFEPSCIHYGELRDGEELIDEVLVVPAVSTLCPGEAGFDICAHGGIRVVERIVMAFARSGARFVPREDSSGWAADSIIEAEVLEGLAQARTRRAVRFLLRQRAALAAELRRIAEMAGQNAQTAMAALESLLNVSRGGRFLVEGATVAISGPSNVGKSTLANRLAGADRSLVSPIPGTTLDWVAHETALAGIPVTLVDTPGYGHSGGALDDLASERARQRAASADLHLRVFDGSQPPPTTDTEYTAGGVAALLVLNKSDLRCVWPDSFTPDSLHCRGMVRVSATRGTNVDALVLEIGRTLGVDWADESITGFFTHRQINLAKKLIHLWRTSALAEDVMVELFGEKR
ncbi:MAG: 50S ribosome-binding GTPase [Phycisphaerae bacterium]|nr:50S ribosome-binding GTPase [Phycisphaerae bacterium]